MDYDDNDTRDQNLHLAGEGSSKISPVLHPYVLPKFDFDDSLHGHLRLDSLVENEVFLGITSQEDNQWIEEYSRGTNAIQFTSSVAESRHKNVWSEATSSESVEMLLKSVGQEERVVQETIIKELDACDKPGSLTDVMDPNLKQRDGKDHSVNAHNAIISDEYHENFIGSKVSSDCEPSHARLTLQSQETQLSGGELDSVVIGDRCSLSAEKKFDKIRGDVDQEEGSNLANESLDNESQEQNVDANIEVLKCRESPQEVPERCIENASGLSMNFPSSEAEHISIDNLTDSGPIVETCTYSAEKPSVVSNVVSVDEPSVEVSIPVDEEHTHSSPIRSCDMKIIEGQIDFGSDDQQVNNQSEMLEGSDANNVGTSSRACSLDELPAEDVSNKDVVAGNNTPKVDTGDAKDKDQSFPAKLSGLLQVGDETQLTEPCAISMDQDVTFNERGDARLPLDSRDMDMEIVGALDSQKNVEDVTFDERGNARLPLDSRDMDVEVVGALDSQKNVEDVTFDERGDARVPLDSRDMDVEVVGALDSQKNVEDVTFDERGDAILPLDSRDMDVEVVGALDSQKKVEPSSSAEGCKGIIAIDQGSESNMAVVTDAVAIAESSKISSPDLPSRGVAIAYIVTEDQPKSPILGVSLFRDDCEEKEEVGFSNEGNSQKATPKVENMVGCALNSSLSVVEKGAVSDRAGKVVHATAGNCDPPVENSNASPSEQAVEDNPGGLECSKTLETSCLPYDSSAQEDDKAESGELDPKGSMTGKHIVEPQTLAVNMSDEQQATIHAAGPSECHANCIVQYGGSSDLRDEPQVLSVSDINIFKLSQSAKDNHEAGKGSMHENVPLLKVIKDVKGQVQSVSSNSGTKEEQGFTFEVKSGPGQTGIQDLMTHSNMKVSSVNSSGSLLDPNKLHEVSLVSPQTPSSAATQAGAKRNSEHKLRQKSVGKERAKKGNHSKETSSGRRSGVVEKSPAPSEELKPNESVESSNLKASGILPIPTSNLPDLNNSTRIFQESFTAIQQVQLRAQILVYGSLIAGMPPEEPHMIAAFGQTDGGRKAWETVWHACLERVRGHKPQANNPETPMQSRSVLKDVGKKDSDQEIKIGSAQSKILTSPKAGPSNTSTSSPVVSPMIPVSSPLWNISTPCDGLQSSAMPRRALLDYRQALSPLHPYQTPGVQNFAVHNPSWPGQWVASSPISAFTARFSAFPVTEAVKLTTVKESSATGISPIPVDHNAGPSVSPGSSSLSNMKKAAMSSGQPLSDSKSKKRKKVAASQTQAASLSTPVSHLPRPPHTEGYNEISFLVQNQTDSGFPTSAVVSTPSMTSKSNPGGFLSAISSASTHAPPTRGDQNVEKGVTTEENWSKIEDSRLQAEAAAVHAAAAISQCQDVWSQLERQKNSCVVDDEAKLAFSVVSIAAAASVAKAAAAAAKIASNVAEQARLMAEEVFLSCKTENSDQSSKFDKAISADHPNSIISAAREAARRRIEAASAAAKHAENLDAIVKAAELAAEAVSQAGKIVSMGTPLPLRDLVEAGPEGCLKTPQLSNQQDYSDKKNVGADPNGKEIQTSKHGSSMQEDSGNLAENQMMVIDISCPITSYVNDKRTPTAHKGPDSSKTVGVIPEPKSGSTHTSVLDQNMPQSTSVTSKETSIKEGCLVEVYKDDNKGKSAWFAANVLSLKDGKAFVCYTEIRSDEGSGQLEEWVPLEVEGKEAPRIRIAHPVTTLRFEGVRKRRRTVMTDYVWSSGDRVDVWVQDCWREGVVLETNKIDVTSLTVQFPAQESSVVRSWHVRPTLIWKDNKWIDWSSLKGSNSSKGDTPLEKRTKLGSPIVEGKKKDKLSKNIDTVESGRREESMILPVSVEECSFYVGKTSREENKLHTRRPMKSGLQKDGPGVVFGVPQPRKKQKFMEVSKHYIAKNDAPNDSAKLVSYLMPKKISKNDDKEKQVAETKSKVVKSRKPPIPSVRSKDKLKSCKTTSHDALMTGKTVKDSVDIDENGSGHVNRMEVGSSSNTEDATGGPAVNLSPALPSDAPKEVLTSKPVSQHVKKGKIAPDGGKTTKVEVKGKSSLEIGEPRRSNRKIQPTSRLLEGLQSSLTISKVPAVPHASQRNHNKVTSKGNTNHG